MLTQAQLRANLDASYLRDKAQYSGRKPNEVGVVVHAAHAGWSQFVHGAIPADDDGGHQRSSLTIW